MFRADLNSYLSDIPLILEQLNIMERDQQNNNNEELNITGNDTGTDEEHSYNRRSLERALVPRISSLENSLVEHINTSRPSLDEMVIRQRGRKKQPSKISWSPVKSPFKTPTKRSSTLHMSLLSPSPAKQLFNSSSSMELRSSPRKRIFTDTPTKANTSLSAPLSSTPTKRSRPSETLVNASNCEVPMRTLLKGLTQDQLINIICDMSAKHNEFEEEIRKNLPLPDIRSFENELCSLRKNITRSSPRSRLLSRTDGAAFARASPHMLAFKKALSNHCKTLNDSQHYDALIDYVLMAWSYVRVLPTWDETSHNILRKDCFKLLSYHAKTALKNGGLKLGADRIASFRSKLKTMMKGDYEEA